MKAKIAAFTHKQTNIFQVQAAQCQTHNFNQIKAFETVSQAEMCDIDSIWYLNSFQLNLSDLLALEMFFTAFVEHEHHTACLWPLPLLYSGPTL